MTSGRLGIYDQHLMKVVKVEDRYAWEVVKTYHDVQPR
jgi:hypothetical protein